MPDNSSKFNTKINFDHKIYEYPDWKNYGKLIIDLIYGGINMMD